MTNKQAAARKRLRSLNKDLNLSTDLITPALTPQQSNAPSHGGILFVENGALKYHGQSGTITTIAVA